MRKRLTDEQKKELIEILKMLEGIKRKLQEFIK